MNILLFVSVIVHVALMPFKRPHHNYLEIASLIINFVLFGSSSYFASGSDTGTSSLALAVDIIRCVACVVLVTVGVVENMACCRHDQHCGPYGLCGLCESGSVSFCPLILRNWKWGELVGDQYSGRGQHGKGGRRREGCKGGRLGCFHPSPSPVRAEHANIMRRR